MPNISMKDFIKSDPTLVILRKTLENMSRDEFLKFYNGTFKALTVADFILERKFPEDYARIVKDNLS